MARRLPDLCSGERLCGNGAHSQPARLGKWQQAKTKEGSRIPRVIMGKRLLSVTWQASSNKQINCSFVLTGISRKATSHAWRGATLQQRQAKLCC